MRHLLALLVLVVLTACGDSGASSEAVGDRPTDVGFVTELMHRDAGLLNLLDAGLGRDLDPAVVAATDQLRIETVQRLEESADLLESWDAKVPVTVRDHSVGHGHSSDHDVPTLEGVPTGEDVQSLPARGPAFEAEFVRLLTAALESTRSLAQSFDAAEPKAGDLAEAASTSCSTTLDAI
ncbi:MAG: hypothetical protein ACRDOM_07310 [Nocardioides sp.]